MGEFNMPRIESGMNVEQLENIVARVLKDLNWLMDGNIDPKNIRVNSITANRMDVDQLSAISADLGTIIAGYIYGTYIATKNGAYPRVELSSVGDQLTALFDANNYVQINPADNNNLPAIIFALNSVLATISCSGGDFSILSGHSQDINITAPDGDIILQPLFSYLVKVKDWNKLFSVDKNQNLQSALDAKANGSGLSGTVYVATTPGGAANTPITFSNGVRTS